MGAVFPNRAVAVAVAVAALAALASSAVLYGTIVSLIIAR